MKVIWPFEGTGVQYVGVVVALQMLFRLGHGLESLRHLELRDVVVARWSGLTNDRRRQETGCL